MLITEIVSSPRFRTYMRCWSGVCTAYTGHLPTGMAGSVVTLESSIGVTTPVGADVGDRLQAIGAVSGTSWLRTYSRSPLVVPTPATRIGIVAGLPAVANGMASLKAWGDPVKRSATSPLRSVAQSPLEGAIKLTGCAVGGSVDSDTFLA